MTPERAHAYRRVLHTLSDIGPSKLFEGEQARIRNAADELIFASDPDDVLVVDALLDIEVLCIALVESGRWEPAGASALADAISACGPARERQAQPV